MPQSFDPASCLSTLLEKRRASSLSHDSVEDQAPAQPWGEILDQALGHERGLLEQVRQSTAGVLETDEFRRCLSQAIENDVHVEFFGHFVACLPRPQSPAPNVVSQAVSSTSAGAARVAERIRALLSGEEMGASLHSVSRLSTRHPHLVERFVSMLVLQIDGFVGKAQTELESVVPSLKDMEGLYQRAASGSLSSSQLADLKGWAGEPRRPRFYQTIEDQVRSRVALEMLAQNANPTARASSPSSCASAPA